MRRAGRSSRTTKRSGKDTEVLSPTGKITRGGWNPNDVTFQEGQKFFVKALKDLGLHPIKRILTSRDLEAKKANEVLLTRNVPLGFKKWQLPFSFYNPTNSYMTLGEPNMKVPTHSHIHGSGFRLIVTGSLTLNGDVELTSGDWFFVPKNTPYSYQVGPLGVSLFAAYEC